MERIARRTSWLVIAGGLACGSVELERPAGDAVGLEQPPADAVTRDGQLRALVSPLIDGQWLTGVSIALVEGGNVQTYGYGAADDGGRVPDGRTVFEIGSVSKTFTSALLADLVRDGSVELDQPVASLLPADVSVPEFGGRAITLLDLATHTSGLPRQPTNWLEEPTREQLLDPYADYQVEDLYEFLSSYALPVAPGERFEYSNLGTGLLAHALSLAAGTSYEEAIRARIAQPLGLRDTTLHPSAEQAQRLAVGHDLDLAAVPGWSFTPAIEGAGALRSTAEDMGRYVAAELAASAPADAGVWPETLLESMALTQTPQRTGVGQPIGLAWFLEGDDIFWHNGETGGFHSFVLVDEAASVGVAVLANAATSVTDALGDQLHQLLVGNTPALLELPAFVTLDVAALEPCVGVYHFGEEIGQDARVELDGEHLFLDLAGRRSRLYPLDATRFWSKQLEVVVRFEPEGAGQYSNLVLEYSVDESYLATR